MEGISSHGTVIYRRVASAWVPIGEIGDTNPPGLTRNAHPTLSHNKDIDSFVGGVLRRNPPTFPVFFNKADGTHDAETGLYQAIIDNEFCGWRMVQPDTFEWVFSGFVQNVQPTAPVDGVQTANVTIQPSGPMYVDGQLVGAVVV